MNEKEKYSGELESEIEEIRKMDEEIEDEQIFSFSGSCGHMYTIMCC
ncbi:MAG: hypothetical protein PHG16_03975 [Lachnospiraceae bacterium]|nr:hypothetical protein [Lachnospiraceae bacterium]